MVDTFKFTIKNNEEFSRLLEKYGEQISDFSIPFRSFASAWFKRNERIFLLKSEGRYAPLGGFNYRQVINGKTKRKRAEEKKERETGHSWAPILFGKTGKLKTATTGGHGSILRVKRTSLVMGVDGRIVPYGKFHNSDKAPRTRIPKRKFIFISGGEDKAQDATVGNDIKAWTLILEKHVEQVLS